MEEFYEGRILEHVKRSTRQTSIVLIDENDVFRAGLVAQLRKQPDFRVAANARDLQTGIGRVLACKPHVVVLEARFNNEDPFAASRTIAARRADTGILFLTHCDHDLYIERALQSRARSFLTKHDSLATICQAIRATARGRSFFSPAIKHRIVHGPNGPKLAEPPSTRLSLLTTRELQVLRHLAEGLSTREIAEVMGISIKTVENHKSNLMTKLDIHDRLKLARFAYRQGLVDP